MSRILITGGNGRLGRVVAAQLSNNPENRVRVMSRRPQPVETKGKVEWALANLETGVGLPEAVAGVQIIVHAATNPFWHTRQVDVEGTRRLLEQAQAAGVEHLIYVSIVGVDRIPYAYYQQKQAAEDIVANGRVPWSIQRATQFFYLLDLALQFMTRLPIALWPNELPDQPIAIEDVAEVLCQAVAASPAGRLPDIGGPEVLSGAQILRTWLSARRMRRVILPLHLPGKAAEGFRKGYHTCPQHAVGKLTWGAWVADTYTRSATERTG